MVGAGEADRVLSRGEKIHRLGNGIVGRGN